MTIVFTEDELQWIDKIPFKWKAKEGCPKKIRRSINRKLSLLKQEQKQLRNMMRKS